MSEILKTSWKMMSDEGAEIYWKNFEKLCKYPDFQKKLDDEMLADIIENGYY